MLPGCDLGKNILKRPTGVLNYLNDLIPQLEPPPPTVSTEIREWFMRFCEMAEKCQSYLTGFQSEDYGGAYHSYGYDSDDDF